MSMSNLVQLGTQTIVMKKCFLLAAVMLCWICAFAEDPTTDTQAGKTDKNGVLITPVMAATPDKFAAQTQRIHEDMQTGGRYEFMKPSDRINVDSLLDQMANLLQRAGSVEAMNHDMRLALFNDQEAVNGVLKHNDSNRLVCESRAPVGSHIPLTTCHTFGQIEATARNTKEGMQQFDLSRVCMARLQTSSARTRTRAGLARTRARR